MDARALRRAGAAVAAVVLAVAAGALALAGGGTRADRVPLRVLAFASEGDGAARARLAEVGARISVLAPQWYALDPATDVLSDHGPESVVLDLARARGIAVWPVVNARLEGGFLTAPERAVRVAEAIAASAAARAYDGITLDVEGVAEADGPAFTAFVADLGARLHGAGRGLAVYVPRRTGARAGPWSRAYDWPALAAAADLVLASGYAEHWETPGPVTTRTGFGRLVAYARAVSAMRVAPVLGALALSWEPGGAPRTLLPAEARREADRPGALPLARDGAHGHRLGAREVWREDAGTLRERLSQVESAGMAWVALFSLGREPRALWSDAALAGGRPALR